MARRCVNGRSLMKTLHIKIVFALSLIAWLTGPTAAIAQTTADERGIARAVSEVLLAFVIEHTGEAAGPLVLDTTQHQLMAHSDDAHAKEKAEPFSATFSASERRTIAADLGWGIRSSAEVVECAERCLLPNNSILFNISKPTIVGDRALVSFSWHHNFAGVIRQNRRLVAMLRTHDQEWEVAAVLGCIRTTGGGPCDLLSGR